MKYKIKKKQKYSSKEMQIRFKRDVNRMQIIMTGSCGAGCEADQVAGEAVQRAEEGPALIIPFQ